MFRSHQRVKRENVAINKSVSDMKWKQQKNIPPGYFYVNMSLAAPVCCHLLSWGRCGKRNGRTIWFDRASDIKWLKDHERSQGGPAWSHSREYHLLAEAQTHDPTSWACILVKQWWSEKPQWNLKNSSVNSCERVFSLGFLKQQRIKVLTSPPSSRLILLSVPSNT